MDERLRELERRWHASGAPRDHANLLRAIRQAKPPEKGQLWTVWIAPSIAGPLIYSVRKKGKAGRRGHDVPGQIATLIGAEEQNGLWYLDDEIAAVALRKTPLPPDWVYKEPPRIVRLLKRKKRLYGLEVELPRPAKKRPLPEIPGYSIDELQYVGDEFDGVYYGAVQQSPSRWWAVAVVDSDTGGFVDTLTEDYGYRSERAARTAARDAAIEWCAFNEVDWRDDQ